MQCTALLLTIYAYFTLLCFYNTAMFTQFILTADTAVSRDFSRMGLSLVAALLLSISYRHCWYVHFCSFKNQEKFQNALFDAHKTSEENMLMTVIFTVSCFIPYIRVMTTAATWPMAFILAALTGFYEQIFQIVVIFNIFDISVELISKCSQRAHDSILNSYNTDRFERKLEGKPVQYVYSYFTQLAAKRAACHFFTASTFVTQVFIYLIRSRNAVQFIAGRETTFGYNPYDRYAIAKNWRRLKFEIWQSASGRASEALGSTLLVAQFHVEIFSMYLFIYNSFVLSFLS